MAHHHTGDTPSGGYSRSPEEIRAARAERYQVNAGGIDEAARACSIGAAAGDGANTAVLLVSHGSHSPSWRQMLLDVHAEAVGALLQLPGVAQVRSAFMEYTEPSIATQLRALDDAGIESVLVVPLLLTISDHSFDDIPAICGQSTDPARIAELESEAIEIYAPSAHLEFAPLLDFTDLVQRNLARRVGRLRDQNPGGPDGEGLVLVGYGSADFDEQWHAFFDRLEVYAEAELGFAGTAHAWCGHLVHYDRQPTIDAIDAVLEQTGRVIVVPIFVAYDPMFQEKIIGRATERCAEPSRVLYSCDSILPDPRVAEWVVEIATELLRTPA